MLVRAFRLTDKLSNAFLKLVVFLAQQMLERIVGLRHAFEATGTAFSSTAITVVQRRNMESEERRQRLQHAIVQRGSEAQLAEFQGKVIEDPLIVRNRALSAFSVILLLALILILIQGPAALRDNGFNGIGGGAIPTRPDSEGELPANIPTSQPTPSPTDRIIASVGGTLVFTLRQNGQEDLWALQVGTNQPLRLTDSLTDDRQPAWSPDGTKIAFASRRDGPWDLYILDVRTSRVSRLTQTFAYEGSPSWSPDGAFIAYEGYREETGSIDIFLISADGQGELCTTPCAITESPFPDLNPSWSPQSRGAREIAYAGYRNGNREILVYDLDGQPEAAATNLTNTPDVNEDYPVWSPDGDQVVYTASVDGISGIYVQDVPSREQLLEGTTIPSSRLIGRGQAATWNPADSSSVFYVTRQGPGWALFLSQINNFASGAPAINFENRIIDVDWALTEAPLQGYSTQTDTLYEERVNEPVALKPLPNVFAMLDPENTAILSDQVDDSFNGMRRQVLGAVGYDLLGTVESGFWSMNRVPELGQEALNWHYTGRAFALNRLLITVSEPLIVVREDTELGTAWRIYAPVAETAQNGALGEPLRDIPWDFSQREQDPVISAEGGRLMETVPPGYYVDLTRLFSDFGWERVLADRTWRANFSGILYWEFEKRDGLDWQTAMTQIYPQSDVLAFLQGETPRPSTPIPTIAPLPEDIDAEGTEPAG